MKPNVYIDPMLLRGIKTIADRLCVSSDEMLGQMTEWYIEEQTKILDKIDEVSDEEIWHMLFGSTYKTRMKNAEKRNVQMNTANNSSQNIIIFPTV